MCPGVPPDANSSWGYFRPFPYFLVAVDEPEGYTGGISGARGFCCRRGNDGCGENQGNEPPEDWHGERLLSRVGWRNSGQVALLGLDALVIKFSAPTKSFLGR